MDNADQKRIRALIDNAIESLGFPVCSTDSTGVLDILDQIHGILYDKHILLGHCPSEECHDLKEQAWNLSLFEALFGPYDKLMGLSEEDRDLILDSLNE